MKEKEWLYFQLITIVFRRLICSFKMITNNLYSLLFPNVSDLLINTIQKDNQIRQLENEAAPLARNQGSREWNLRQISVSEGRFLSVEKWA